MNRIGEPGEAIDVLLIEDNPADARLTCEAFRGANPAVRLHVVADGEEAMAFLRQEEPYLDAPRPNLILLDLNLPKLHGREVLAQIRDDVRLTYIPVVVLTTSRAEEDVFKSYRLRANCYLVKPVLLPDFERVVTSINACWLSGMAGAPPPVVAHWWA